MRGKLGNQAKKMAIDECRSLYEGTKIYGDSVEAFLVEIRKTEEASRNPILGASVAAARNHFFAVQRELQRVWELYERLSIQQQYPRCGESPQSAEDRSADDPSGASNSN